MVGAEKGWGQWESWPRERERERGGGREWGGGGNGGGGGGGGGVGEEGEVVRLPVGVRSKAEPGER